MYLAITKVQSKSYINLSLSNFYGRKCCLLKMMYKAYKLTNPYEHLYNNEPKHMNHVNQEFLSWESLTGRSVNPLKYIFLNAYFKKCTHVCTFFFERE